LTTLAGTIRENMVFNSGDNVELADDVRIADGYTLTFNEGSSLEGNSNSLDIDGTVLFNGSSTSLIEITNVSFDGKGGTLRLTYVSVSNGSIFPKYQNDGSLSISYSLLQNVNEIDNPESTVIRNSIFNNTSINNTDSETLSLIENTFIGASKVVATAAAFSGSSDNYILIEGNNFLADGVALEFSGLFGYEHDVMTSGNYWGSISADIIDLKIIDGKDDPDIEVMVDLALKSGTYTAAPLELGKYTVDTTTGLLTENSTAAPREPALIDDDNYYWDADIDLGNGEVLSADNAQVYRAYYGALGRLPDEDGFDWWLNAINTREHDLNSMAAGFIDSEEFESMADNNRDGFISNDEFINHMYIGVFGRQPDADGLDWWLGRLDSGAKTQASAFIDMTQSNEYVELTLLAVAEFEFL